MKMTKMTALLLAAAMALTACGSTPAASRTALEQSAAGQGVQHLVLHSADIFQ